MEKAGKRKLEMSLTPLATKALSKIFTDSDTSGNAEWRIAA